MNIFIVAGEASGDLHGSNLIKSLKEIDQSLVFYGIGGEKMKSLGFDAVEDSRELAVVGISEVFLKLGRLFTAFNKLKKALDERIEVDIYQKAGVDVEYVGHPLSATVSSQFSKDGALAEFGMAQCQTVALLPGSRRDEVNRLLPVMLEAAATIKREIKDIQFILPLADTIEQVFVEDIIRDVGCEKSFFRLPSPTSCLRIVSGRLYEALRASDAAIVASGTATLETALMEIPMVIVYKLSFLTAIIGRIFVHIDDVGLPNIVAGRRIVPELIQEYATPSAIAENILRILKDKGEREKMISELKEVGKRLGKVDASRNAAEKIYKVATQNSKRKSQNLN
ncbi:MAG: hypothetical protein HY265_01785 [Deltaproteobacteria bacterium]|nr:hypothetical protein [Deltaproteobacteria bacterium]